VRSWIHGNPLLRTSLVLFKYWPPLGKERITYMLGTSLFETTFPIEIQKTSSAVAKAVCKITTPKINHQMYLGF